MAAPTDYTKNVFAISLGLAAMDFAHLSPSQSPEWVIMKARDFIYGYSKEDLEMKFLRYYERYKDIYFSKDE